MYRYRAIASFHLWKPVCALAMNVTRALLEANGAAARIANFDAFWSDFHAYIEALHATGRTEAEILAPQEATLRYDIAGMLKSDDVGNPAPFRLSAPRRFSFRLSDEGRREMQSSLAVWTTHIRGLSKLVTRIRVESQVRLCSVLESELEPT
jgi:hypothetical protein